MMKKSLIKGSLVYFIANMINALIPFLLLPILTRVLTPEEYGQVAMFSLFITGLSAFVGLNVVGAAARHFYNDDSSHASVRQYNSACLWVLLFSTFLIFIITYIFSGVLSDFLSLPVSWLYIALMSSFFSFLLQFRLSQWQVRENPVSYGVLQVLCSVLNVGASLYLVLYADNGSEGRIAGIAFSFLVCGLVATFLLYKEDLLGFSFLNKAYLKDALNFGVPLIPHIFGIFLLTSIDRFVINTELGLAHVGIYLLAYQLSSAISIVFDSLNKALLPWLYRSLSSGCTIIREKIVRRTYLIFISLIFLALLNFVISPIVLLFVAGDEYAEASKIISWLVLGQIFSGMYLFVTNYIFFSKQTAALSVVTICVGAGNLLLLFMLIPKYGLLGAAYAFSISMFFRFLFTWYLAAKKVEMPWLYFVKSRVL
ncbi:oligosaccharide flippase family protein [Pseudoalteromonas rubra]|nr:oligosaccharide flippase family protein [Pseudoalteromonas rubra]